MATILTPDQRLRVFVSSTLQELAKERKAAEAAIQDLRLSPVMFELGARPHPPRDLYRAYLEQSHIFVGIYWQRYGWVAPGEEVSGLEDEYRLSGDRPKLIYVKNPAPEREARLRELLHRIQNDDRVSYKPFTTPRELRRLLEDDLAVLLTERFTAASTPHVEAEKVEAVPLHRHLPTPPTPLIGREKELADVSQLLLDEEVRLVTLSGPGGVGKSRLALEVASRLQGRFRDGVIFVPLSAVNDPALVIPAIAGVLGVREGGGLPLLESLRQHLLDKQLLLLLDNFEQLVAAAPALSELLAATSALELLVTSRSALRLSGEHVFEVPPLALPGAGISPFEEIRRTEAVRLFVERAKSVKPTFDLSVDNALAVAEICYRLDGLPLAIELAAAYVRMFTPQTLLKRLEKRFELLKGGARDLPSRQQTLRNAIDWSYGLLNDSEKKLLARLGVFAGGSSFEAAEAVCAEGAENLFEDLSSLVDKSLVRQNEVGAEPRFSMLETVREYATEKLEASGEAEEVRGRHAGFFLELTEEADGQLKSGDQAFWVNRLEVEHNNLRAALRWTLHHDLKLALRLGNNLIRFWMMHNHFSEGRRWLNDVLIGLGDMSPSAAYAKACNGAGVLAWSQGDFSAAQAYFGKSRDAYQALGDAMGVAHALSNIGGLAVEHGNYRDARDLYEQVLALWRNLDDQDGVALALVNLGLINLHKRDFGSARKLFEEALTLYRALGDKWRVAAALMNLGVTVLRLGDVKAARAFLSESLELSSTLGDKENIAHDLIGFAALAATLEEDHHAARLWGAAEALREAIGYQVLPSSTFEEERVLREAVEARLGSSLYTTAWAEGRELGLEHAVALALQRPKP